MRTQLLDPIPVLGVFVLFAIITLGFYEIGFQELCSHGGGSLSRARRSAALMRRSLAARMAVRRTICDGQSPLRRA